MLDQFLKVAYETQRRETYTGELHDLLMQLPVDEIGTLASGVSIKEAYGDCMPEERQTFLDKFKGSPLIEQAIALEQEEIQADMLSMQKREERRVEQQAEDNVWDLKDKIRLKRRLLELQLAKEQAGMGAAPGAAPVPGETAQGAGAPGDVPVEGVQDNAQGLGGKTASVKSPAATLEKEKFAFAEGLGRTLARDEVKQLEFQKIAEKAGALMAKQALNLSGVSGALSKLGPMASKALGFAAKNPSLVGAGLGAAGGAIAGGPEHRLSGALGGAALGGAAGNAAGGIAQGMKGGKGFLESAKGYGQGVVGKVQGLMGKTQQTPPPPM
jgi:hypothetical protein